MAFLYEQVKEEIEAQILEGKLSNGVKLPGEKELMEAFHVSRQTVRNAIAALTNEGVLYSVQGKGTFVRDMSVLLKRQYIIGFSTIDFKTYNLYPKILREVNRFTEECGYNLMLGQTKNTLESERACLLNFLEKNVDAAILDPSHCGLPNSNEDIYRMFEERNKPLIMYSARHFNETASYVVADDIMGGYLATKHLLELGHRRIGGIFQADDVRGYDRCQGMIQAMHEYNVPVQTDYLDWYSAMRIGMLDEMRLQKPDFALKRILSDCTAVVVYNDIITQYVLYVLSDLNMRCPDDISIVSFDDTVLNSGQIDLTTIPYPDIKIGECLGETVLRLLHDPTQKIQVKVPVELIARGSTRRIDS